MTKLQEFEGLNFGGSATYEIVVQGKLGGDWSDRIAGMAISDESGSNGRSRTKLRGPIRDQAELNGVLETLYGLHLSIIKVEQVDDEK